MFTAQSDFVNNNYNMEVENLHWFFLIALGLLLILYYLSPFELSVNEEEDDE